jgi:hypothetical protein
MHGGHQPRRVLLRVDALHGMLLCPSLPRPLSRLMLPSRRPCLQVVCFYALLGEFGVAAPAEDVAAAGSLECEYTALRCAGVACPGWM